MALLPFSLRVSAHRDHADRSIMIKKIGVVITGIGAS
jgi:hypothetical protein